MNTRVPKVGDLVLYMLASYDVSGINQRRKDAREKSDWHQALKTGAQLHSGNEVTGGKQYPATVVAVWGTTPGACVNLQVQLDGTDTFWATSRNFGNDPGQFQYRDAGVPVPTLDETEAEQKREAADAACEGPAN